MRGCRSREAPEEPAPEQEMSDTQSMSRSHVSPLASFRFRPGCTMVEENVRLMADLVGSVSHSLGEHPSTLVFLHMIAENDDGWQRVIRALISNAPLHKPLATSSIAMIFNDCPLPPVGVVLETIHELKLCRARALSCNNSEEAKCRERNTLALLGCMAIKFSGPITTKLLDQDTMEYLYAFLTDVRIPILVLHAIISIENFARSKESKADLVEFLANQEAQNPLVPLEGLYDSTNVISQQVGFCARWLLDNIFLVQERALSYTKVDMSNTNAVLEFRDSTDFLKISPDGLEARCDSITFEFVRCTFQVVTGCWYYEAEIVTSGTMQIGWAAKDTHFTSHVGYGIEDSNLTLAYDGCRRTIWHKTVPKLCHDAEQWSEGDIIGCLIDVSKQEAIFSVNGVRLPTFKDIFRNYGPFADSMPKRRESFFAAASLSCFQAVRFNFGLREFRFPPVDRGFMVFNKHGIMTVEEKQIIPRWMHSEQVKALEAEKNEDNEKLCAICYDRETKTLAEPCHHMSFCYECAARLSKCPVCFKNIWTMNSETD